MRRRVTAIFMGGPVHGRTSVVGTEVVRFMLYPKPPILITDADADTEPTNVELEFIEYRADEQVDSNTWIYREVTGGPI